MATNKNQQQHRGMDVRKVKFPSIVLANLHFFRTAKQEIDVQMGRRRATCDKLPVTGRLELLEGLSGGLHGSTGRSTSRATVACAHNENAFQRS